jgi:hypothetical protein
LINIRAQLAGLRIAEVPSFEHSRIYGESNLHVWRDGWRVLKTILREWKSSNRKVVVSEPGRLSPSRESVG